VASKEEAAPNPDLEHAFLEARVEDVVPVGFHKLPGSLAGVTVARQSAQNVTAAEMRRGRQLPRGTVKASPGT
jgi:hypothetical protein